MSEPTATQSASGISTAALELKLMVEDREMIADLEAFAEGAERATFALNALRIGLLALKQARGRIDADAVKAEGEKMLASLAAVLQQHELLMTSGVKTTLSTYFDPSTGKFSERVEQLLRKDGDLEVALKRQVDGEASALGKTLAQGVGTNSPLFKILSPTQSDGIVSLLRTAVETELAVQRRTILDEFSLDRDNSALSRLVLEVEKKSGKLGTDLKTQIDIAVGELSLDKDGSALHRLRSELLALIAQQTTANTSFQTDVRATLERLAERKAEAARSTRHGLAFEDEVGRIVIEAAQRAGDIAAPTGAETGLIRQSKKGDFVVELGPERVAAGAKVVVEAKEVAGYTLAQARTEIDEARRNRGAGVGVFVFSRRTAPEGAQSLVRIGDDIFLLWDPEDASTDVWLHAGLTLASALVSRATPRKDETRQDFEALDRAVNEVERQATELDQIRTAAETVQGGASRILERVRIARAALERQVETLRQGLIEIHHEDGE